MDKYIPTYILCHRGLMNNEVSNIENKIQSILKGG